MFGAIVGDTGLEQRRQNATFPAILDSVNAQGNANIILDEIVATINNLPADQFERLKTLIRQTEAQPIDNA